MHASARTAAGPRSPRLHLFSASSREALARGLRSAVSDAGADAPAVAGAPQGGGHRLALVAAGQGEFEDAAERALSALREREDPRWNLGNRALYRDAARAPDAGRLAVLFPGYGAPEGGLAERLGLISPAVRRWLAGQRGRGAVFGAAAGAGGALGAMLDAALTADLAMWGLLEDLGLRCDLFVGHSFGEHAALVAAGMAPGLDALEELFSTLGGVRQGGAGPGEVQDGLLAVTAAAAPLIGADLAERGGRVRVALDNCPQQQVLWGPAEDLARIEARLKAEGQVCYRLGALTTPVHTPPLRCRSSSSGAATRRSICARPGHRSGAAAASGGCRRSAAPARTGWRPSGTSPCAFARPWRACSTRAFAPSSRSAPVSTCPVSCATRCVAKG